MEKGQKICPHCDAFIDMQVIICPYCGGDVSEEVEEHYSYSSQEEKDHLSSNHAISSLYPPPYEPKVQENVDIMEEEEEPVASKKGNIFLSTLILSFGVNLLAIGLFLFFFSKNGQLLLRFNSSFWFLYILTGAPAIYWGVRTLSRALKAQEE